jgi:hypothetical protein
MTSIRTIGITAAASLALVLGSGAVAANAATPAPTASSSTCSFGQHLLSAWKTVPADLRSDLKAAKAMKPGKDRRADLVKIHDKALDGGYGAGVEAKAEWLKAHPGERLRPLPGNLKSDLKALHADPKSKKVAEAAAIAAKAIAGTYGTKVESFANAVKSSAAWQDCTPAGS